MIDLWELIVVDMFNSFWMAVLGLVLLMYIVFAIGKISQVTRLNFLLLFLFSMCIGYAPLLITIPIAIAIILINIMAIPKFLNN